MATLIEASILPLWFKVGRMFAMERDIRIASVLYFFCPVSFQFALIDGQNSVAIAACIVLAMLLLSRNKVALCGVLVGLSIITVKFLPLLYVPSFVRASAQRVRWLLGFTATLVAGYSFFLLRHAPIFQPLLFEGGMRTSGNLPYLVEAVAGVTLPARIWDLLVIAVLFSIFIFSGLKKHERTIPIDLNYLTSTMLAFTFSLLLLAKKSAPAYMMMVLFPLCLLLSATTRLRRCFGLSFLVIAIAEPSIWFTLLGAINAPALHLALSRHRPLTVAFLGLQATMVLGYGWLLWMSLLRLATTSQLQQSCSTNRLDSIDAPLNASI